VALRRVAALVARKASPPEVFAAATREAGLLAGADFARIERHETDGTVTVVARWSAPTAPDDREAGAPGMGSSICCPIVVEGRLWGAIAASSEGLLPDIESQMAGIGDLVGAAIATAGTRAELAALSSRAVKVADEIRGRLGRDLHDGAQQSLVHTVITLKLARQALADGDGPVAGLVDEALEHAARATAELRDLVHGILPAPLNGGGLRGGIEALASRVRLPLRVDVTAERLAPDVEATAYFIVAEALTNAVKHAHAGSAQVRASVERGALQLEVRDDGVGGARVDGGSGLLGLHDRAAALGGELSVESPRGRGTVVAATLPLGGG
jgi:signal transduction histidine kinase